MRILTLAIGGLIVIRLLVDAAEPPTAPSLPKVEHKDVKLAHGANRFCLNCHQFAQPDRDFRSNHPEARVIYLRPILGRRPDLIALAVS